jgi:putative two-component system response regulator
MDKMQDIINNMAQQAQSAENERNAEEACSDKRRKIILVDDVQFQLMSIKERLREHYEVYPAQSTDEMYKLLEKIKPEMILLDVNMPDTDGYETIRLLKEDPCYAAIPVVFLSGSYDPKNVVKGMKLGAVDFVRKPFDLAVLHNCIEYHLNPAKRAENKPIILAVDDNPSILRTINAILQERNKVYTLNNPKQLSALLGMITPDLFLLDCNMPGLSGFDLVPIIRKMPQHEDTPIIFLTSDGTIDNISAAMGFGARDFIVKPIDMMILRDKTTEHLKDFIMYRRIRKEKK